MASRPRALPPWLLALAGFVALAACRGLEARVEGFNVYDEWLPLVAGQRILQGEHPYREFAPTYGPAEPALVALLSWSGSPQLLALRLLRGLGVAALAVLAAACLWRSGSRAGAPFLVILVFTEAGPFTSPALACVLGALLLFDVARAADPTTRARALLGAGALAGLAGTFRSESGLVLVVLGLISIAWLPRPAWGRSVLAFLAGGLPFAALYGGLIVAGGVEPFLAHVREMRAHLPARSLPYPLPPSGELGAGEWWAGLISASLPLLVAAVAPVSLAWGWRRHLAGRGAPPSLLSTQLTLLLLLSLPYALWRPDAPHRFPSYLYAACWLCSLLPGIEARLGRRQGRQIERALHGVLGLLVVLRLALALGEARAAGQVRSQLRGLSGVFHDAEAEALLAETVRQIERRAPPGAPLYVGLDDHARVFMADVMLYVLVGRPVALRTHHLLPGVANTEPFQREVIAQLEAEPRPVVVLARHLWREEPNASRERGAELLDTWLGQRFGVAYENRDYLVLQRLSD